MYYLRRRGSIVIDFKVFFSALAAARMVRGCSPAVCNCRRKLYTTGQGERKDAGGADFVPLPLTSKVSFTGVLIRY